MYDQAKELRNLVLRAKASLQSSGPPPYLVAVTGGKGGVGTTTLAINVAVALGQLGKRVVLVDADLRRGDVAALCDLKEDYSVADVMSARRTVHETLQRGPAGIQILPGAGSPSDPLPWSPLAQQRLVQQLKSLGRHADIILLDVGSGPSEMLQRYWQAADRILLVTTADSTAITDTYASIKVLGADTCQVSIDIVVNRAEHEGQATRVQQRLYASCRRFLKQLTGNAGYVPEDDQAAASPQVTTPVVIRAPHCPATRSIERIAATLATSARPNTHDSRLVQPKNTA